MAEFNQSDDVWSVGSVEDMVFDCDEEWNGQYHPKFPNPWRESQYEGTGPEQCSGCATHGCYKGEFIGYCMNCAICVYEGSRGRGFVGNCVEWDDPVACQYASAYETYLCDVEFAQFADEIRMQNAEDDSQDVMDTVEYGGSGGIMECHYEGGYNDF
jgi:hypothetical protein